MSPVRFAALHRSHLFPSSDHLPTPLTLAIAPLGYGKTTLVTQWLDSAAMTQFEKRWIRCQWIHTKEDLWRALHTALTEDDSERNTLDVSDPDEDAGQAGKEGEAVTRVIKKLTTPTMLVLTGYHLVTTLELDLALCSLLRTSHHLYITVIGRHVTVLDGPLATSKIPTTILRSNDLVFAPSEVKELAKIYDRDPTTLPAFVLADTQGWPLATSLAMQVLKDGHSRQQFDKVMNRLVREQLDMVRLFHAERVYLLILLCDYVTADLLRKALPEASEDMEEILTALEDWALIVHLWYPSGARYTVPRRKLKAYEQKGIIQFGQETLWELRRENAISFAKDDPETAVIQLMDLGELEEAERIFTLNFLSMLSPSAQFAAALRRMPLAELEPYPIFNGALLLVEMGDPLTPPPMLTRIYAQLYASALKALDHPSFDKTVGMVASAIVAQRLGGAGENALRLSRHLEQRIDRSSAEERKNLEAVLPLIYAIIALCALLNGDSALAERGFRKTLDLAVKLGDESEQVRGWSGLAAVMAVAGDLPAARYCLHRLEQFMHTTGAQAPQLSWVNQAVAKAILAAEEGDIEGFRAALAPVEDIFDRAKQSALLVHTEVFLLRSTCGSWAALTTLCQRIPQISSVFHTSPYLLTSLTALRADLAIYLGGYQGAHALLKDLPRTHPLVSQSYARLALFDNKLEEALTRATAFLGGKVSARREAEFALIATVAAWEMGDRERASEYLIPAARLIHQGGSTLVLGGVPHESLVNATRYALRQSEEENSENTVMIASMATALSALPQTFQISRAEPLSQAEYRTLHALNSDFCRTEIAEHLYISPNTVKSHIRSVYRKLGVSTRKEALERAETLGLFL